MTPFQTTYVTAPAMNGPEQRRLLSIQATAIITAAYLQYRRESATAYSAAEQNITGPELATIIANIQGALNS